MQDQRNSKNTILSQKRLLIGLNKTIYLVIIHWNNFKIMLLEDDKGNPLIGSKNEVTICGTYQEGCLTKS